MKDLFCKMISLDNESVFAFRFRVCEVARKYEVDSVITSDCNCCSL